MTATTRAPTSPKSPKMPKRLVIACKLIGTSPMSQGKYIATKREEGETPPAFEERTHKERLHVAANGNVFIPAMALKLCLTEVARYLAETIPGKGKATYTKHFEAGILVPENLDTGIHADKVEWDRLFLPSDGTRGGGRRVEKIMPRIDKWTATAKIEVFDPVLIGSPNKIKEYLNQAGQFIGLGVFRPRNGGHFGRFRVEDFEIIQTDQ